MQLSDQERERFEHLLMAALDGELAPQEQAQFDRYLRDYPECAREYQRYRTLKEVTSTMQFQKPPLEVWDSYWTRVYNRLERGLGWILFSIGAIVLLTYGLYHAVESLIADPGLAPVVKLGMLGVIAGLVILLVSVIREKLFTAKSDRYQKEVQR